MSKEQIDVIDLMLNTLREHEKELDTQVNEFKDTLEEMKRFAGRLSPEKSQAIVAALVFAIKSELKSADKTTTSLFVTEFFHSLNRKGLIGEETYDLITQAGELLEARR